MADRERGRRSERRVGDRRVAGNLGWLDALLDAVIVVDDAGVVHQWSRAAEQVFGWRREHALGRELAELIIPEELRAAHRAGLDRLRSTGQPTIIGQRLELPALRSDGRRIAVELTITSATGWDGEVYVGFVRDLTALKEAQRQVEASEHRFRAIVEHSPAIISILHRDGTWESSTAAGTRILGWDRGHEAEGGIFGLVHPADAEYARATFEEVVRGERGPDEPVQFRVQAADGTWRWLETAADNLLDDPAVDAIVLHSRDVTAQREADHLLRQSADRIAAVVDHLEAGVLIEDSERRVALVNERFIQIFGIPLPPVAIVGQEATDLSPFAPLFEDPEAFVAGVESLVASGAEQRETILHLADGRILERDSIPLAIDGVPQGRVWLYWDVTAAREIESQRERLLEAERDVRLAIEEQNTRLRQLDQLRTDFVANASHELRTPLTSIIGFSEMLLEEFDGPLTAAQREHLEVIDRSSRRMQRLVEDLLLVSRLESRTMPMDRHEVDVASVVRQSLAEMAPRAETAGVTLTAAVAEGPLRLGDAGRLGQAVDNLVVNALKFTPRGGEVEVTAGHDGAAWVITVRDTGIGIPADEVGNLFSKFFRASNAEHGDVPGTGLGLAIVQAIVEVHHGTVQVASTENEGTTFTIRLPD